MDRYINDMPSDAVESNRFVKTFRSCCDKIVPYTITRWMLLLWLCIFYIIRVAFLQGFFVVSYALAIFVLSQFLAFLTPQFQPNKSGDPLLPTNSDGEFRPFMRRLSEFKFWKSSSIATAISILCTFFPIFDLPVFWPVLLVYFLTLFFVTMRRQIEHMIRYRYLPFTYGKPRPQGKAASSSLQSI